MSFDPEKVEPWEEDGVGSWIVSWDDYQKLLELYRAVQNNVRPLCSHGCIDGQCAICK